MLVVVLHGPSIPSVTCSEQGESNGGSIYRRGRRIGIRIPGKKCRIQRKLREKSTKRLLEKAECRYRRKAR